ncbi:cathepsin F-like cysteine proteinase, putative [Brugia malayi]|uniref:BMA-TAG-196 n=2 Tax=Brugia TaxID=6278 RepID=A0A0J9XKB3_BRUMA|nr:cathepsin F-like cysteine proteinase, putative [Brugia malayi]CDP90584.1 BMA-TAG-196 [Brugia malayi]VIO99137.1 cathepsin F-like cysteine proteinase, putative [Brugia malayi]
MLANCLIILFGLQAVLAIEKPSLLVSKHEKLLSSAMAEYNSISNDKNLWIPVKILDMNTIPRNGKHFSIKIAIALSNCTKTADNNFDSNYCKAKNETGLKACVFEIFQPSWKMLWKIKFLTCSDYVPSERIIKENSDRSNMKSLDLAMNSQEWQNEEKKTLWSDFMTFIKKFKREYSSIEEQLDRFRIYLQNMNFAKKLQFEEKGTAIYGATKFSDMTAEEFQKIMLPSIWWDRVESNGITFNLNDFNLSINNLPSKFDWRTEGVVTPVKDQGSCGSCWAFSVTGNIESLWAIKTGKLISLSEQELIDCDVIDKGCNGGLPINAFREIKRMGGLEPEDQYPYEAKNGTCHLVRAQIAVSIDDAVEIPRNETVMKAWIAQRGPLSVGIDAELLSYYKSGILHPSKSRCPPSKINHGVLITGYGIEDNLPYWTIKNSWGEQWGENGYFRLMRGKDICGVSDLVSSAIIY